MYYYFKLQNNQKFLLWTQSSVCVCVCVRVCVCVNKTSWSLRRYCKSWCRKKTDCFHHCSMGNCNYPNTQDDHLCLNCLACPGKRAFYPNCYGQFYRLDLPGDALVLFPLSWVTHVSLKIRPSPPLVFCFVFFPFLTCSPILTCFITTSSNSSPMSYSSHKWKSVPSWKPWFSLATNSRTMSVRSCS